MNMYVEKLYKEMFKLLKTSITSVKIKFDFKNI